MMMYVFFSRGASQIQGVRARPWVSNVFFVLAFVSSMFEQFIKFRLVFTWLRVENYSSSNFGVSTSHCLAFLYLPLRAETKKCHVYYYG